MSNKRRIARKANKPILSNTLPTQTYGSDGDISLSSNNSFGTLLSVKSKNQWWSVKLKNLKDLDSNLFTNAEFTGKIKFSKKTSVTFLNGFKTPSDIYLRNSKIYFDMSEDTPNDYITGGLNTLDFYTNGTKRLAISDSSLELSGSLKIGSVSSGTGSLENFLVIAGTEVKKRTAAQVRSDLGISDDEIIDWTADQGDTNIHTGNYTDTNTNQLTEFTLTGDSGSNQTIAHGNTLDISGGTNCTTVVGATDTVTVNVDDSFLVNDASDTTTGTITAGGFTTTGTWTFDDATSGTVGITTVHTGSSFTDNDTSLMTAGAIKEKIEDYGYSTTTGDITGVTITTDSGGGSKAQDTEGRADFSILGSNGVGVTNSSETITVTAVPGEIDHDSLNNFAANEHIDWTASSAGTIHSTNYTDTNTNQLTTFDVDADSGTAETIAHGNTLQLTGGTGIDTTVSSTDTVTFALSSGAALSNLSGGSGTTFLKKDGTWATPTDTNTQNTTTLSFVDSSDDIILRNTTGGAGSGTDDIKFVAGSNITLTHTDADNITIASTDTNTTYSVMASGNSYAAGLVAAGSGTHSNQFLRKDGTWVVPTDTDTNTNQLTTFTVSATTDSNATTISQGDDLMFAAGTGITCETTADGTVTITNTVSDTNTTYSAGSLLDLSTTTFNVDLTELTDGTADVVGSADELVYLDDGVQKRKQIDEIKLGQFNNDQGWTSNTGDITGVDLTGGTGISIDSETNTTSGSYSATITCNVEGTEIVSTGETGGSKFLREDGDGTCSWQTVSGGGGASALNDLSDVTYSSGDLTISSLDKIISGNLDFDSSGHINFDGCAAGFTRIAYTRAANVEVDFTTGNKAHLDMTGGNIAGTLTLKFPAVSGNFVLIIQQDGSTRTIANYATKDAAGNAGDNDGGTAGAVRWAGGSVPDLTDGGNKRDVLSFYWDATEEVCYGVASLNF